MTSLEYYIEQVEQFISALTDDIESGEGTVVTQTKLAVYQEVLEHLEEIEQEPCDDAISRQAAIEAFQMFREYESNRSNKEWVDRIETVLNKLPPVNSLPEDDDYFARWVAEEIFDDNWEYNKDAFAELACRKLAKLGIVIRMGDNWELIEPQESKIGHWIVHEKPHGIRYLECPYCNIWYLNEHLIRNSYCPNCGARMIEPQEREG